MAEESVEKVWNEQQEYLQEIQNMNGFTLQKHQLDAGMASKRRTPGEPPCKELLIISHAELPQKGDIALVALYGKLGFIAAKEMETLRAEINKAMGALKFNKRKEELNAKKANSLDLIGAGKDLKPPAAERPVQRAQSPTVPIIPPRSEPPSAALSQVIIHETKTTAAEVLRGSTPASNVLVAAALSISSPPINNASDRDPPYDPASAASIITSKASLEPKSNFFMQAPMTQNINTLEQYPIDMFTFGSMISGKRIAMEMTERELADSVNRYVETNTPEIPFDEVTEKLVRLWELARALPKEHEFEALSAILIDDNLQIPPSDKADKHKEFKAAYEKVRSIFTTEFRPPTGTEAHEFNTFIFDRREEIGLLENNSSFARKINDKMKARMIKHTVTPNDIADIESPRYQERKQPAIVREALYQALDIKNGIAERANLAWDAIPEKPKTYVDAIMEEQRRKLAKTPSELLQVQKDKLWAYFSDEAGAKMKQSDISRLSDNGLSASMISIHFGSGVAIRPMVAEQNQHYVNVLKKLGKNEGEIKAFMSEVAEYNRLVNLIQGQQR